MREKTILLVEDNPDDVDLTLRAFKKSNVTNKIIVAKNGAEALDYLFATDSDAGQRTQLPEVVLLDLNLPKVPGLEVLRRIRSSPRTKILPVVILTSSTEERDLVESYNLGANSYVHKPVDFAQFVDAARQLGLYWLVLNRLPSSEG